MTAGEHAQPAMARLFVASTPAGEQLRMLAGLQQQLAAALPAARLRWNPPADLHLTLRFLGDTPLEAVAALAPRLDDTAGRHPRCAVSGGSLQVWPNRRATLLVVEFASTPALDALVADLEQQARGLGYTAETRPYRPHVTLARGRQAPDIAVPTIVGDAFAFDIDAIDLYVSMADQQPRRYRHLHRSPLLRPTASQHAADQSGA